MASVRSVGNVDLSVGLVTCPVKMIGVIDGHDRKGSMFHKHDDGQYGKVKMPKLCEDCGEVVPTAEIAKGFEENGNMVMLSADEMTTVTANTGTDTAVSIPHFVKAEQVDPMLFANENVYRLVPDVKRGRQAVTTYKMIRRMLTEKKLVGVVQYTRWGRNRLGLLDVEPTTGVLMIRNMMWPDELRGTEGLLPDGADDDGDIDPRLMPVMESVVESMTADWNPAAYADTYTVALNEAIEAKAAGNEIATITSEGESSIDDVAELLAALEASVAKKAPAKKAAAKKAPAKKAAAQKEVA